MNERKEQHLLKARHKFKTRWLDIVRFMLSRPEGTSVMQIAQGIKVSLASAERYLSKMKDRGDIELARAEPIKGVSKKPIKYYILTADAELDYYNREDK